MLFASNFLCLLDVGGMKEQIYVQYNREQLSSNYSHSYSDFYFHNDSEDSDLSDYDQEIGELIPNQFRQSFCFSKLRLYNFNYTRLYFHCRSTFKMVFEPKLHIFFLVLIFACSM